MKPEPATPPDSPLLKLVRASAHENPTEAILTLANVLEQSIVHTRLAEELASATKERSIETLALAQEIKSSVVRIEARLGTAEESIANVARRRGSQDEIVEGFARVALAKEHDEIQASKEARAAIWAAVGKGSAFVFSVAGAGVVLGALLKACAGEARGEPPVPVDAVDGGASVVLSSEP